MKSSVSGILKGSLIILAGLTLAVGASGWIPGLSTPAARAQDASPNPSAGSATNPTAGSATNPSAGSATNPSAGTAANPSAGTAANPTAGPGTALSANPANASSPAGASKADVVQKGSNGQVDWSQGSIMAYGEGSVPATATNPGQARLLAIRAARLDALRNILEMTQAIHITATTTVAQAMVASDEIKTQVEGVIQGAQQVGDPVYLSDATVKVTMSVPVAQGLAAAVLPPTGFSAEAPRSFPPVPKGATTYTGLIIDARKLGVKPAMAPHVLDTAGNEVYGTSQVNRDYAVEQGMVGYAKTLEAARADSRVSDNPLVARATQALGAAKTDVQVSDDDAKAIRDAAGKMSFLSQCRVIIVVD